MQQAIQDYLNGLCCPEPVVPLFNFDVTANWATGDANFPVTDQSSFEAFLANRSYNSTNDLTSIVITDFNLQGNRLQCNLTANGTVLDISEMVVTEISSIGNITSLIQLELSANQIVTFNPSIALPISLQVLGLGDNQMTTAGYTASESWANNLHNAPSGGIIIFSNNIDSVTGTNLEAILISKGWTVNV
jgi:Leucine-rich repeat (LRR) protein